MKTLLLASAMALGATSLAHAQTPEGDTTQTEVTPAAPTDPLPAPAPATPGTPTDPAMPQSPTTQDPAVAQTPMPPTEAADPTMPQPPEPAASASTSTSANAGQSAAFATFDKDSNGQLTPLEFAYLTVSTRDAAAGAEKAADAEKQRTSKRADNPAVDLINETAAELAQADTNGDFKVSADEFAATGQGGPN